MAWHGPTGICGCCDEPSSVSSSSNPCACDGGTTFAFVAEVDFLPSISVDVQALAYGVTDPPYTCDVSPVGQTFTKLTRSGLDAANGTHVFPFTFDETCANFTITDQVFDPSAIEFNYTLTYERAGVITCTNTVLQRVMGIQSDNTGGVPPEPIGRAIPLSAVVGADLEIIGTCPFDYTAQPTRTWELRYTYRDPFGNNQQVSAGFMTVSIQIVAT